MTLRWIKIRSATEGWVTVNADMITKISPCGFGFSIHLLCGSLILVNNREGNRVITRLLAKGITP